VTISGTIEQPESTERRVAKGGATDDVVKGDRAEVAAVGRMIAAVPDDDEALRLDLGDALQEQTRSLARIAYQDDVAGSGRPARRDDE
jgi:hypothetical protein